MEEELGPGSCPCPRAAGGERGTAGGCRCPALPAPRQGVTENARRRLREFDVGDKFSRLPLPRAAVLLPLMVRGGRLHLLLTVRSMQVPGGLRGARSFPASRGCAPSRDLRTPVPTLVPQRTARCFYTAVILVFACPESAGSPESRDRKR